MTECCPDHRENKLGKRSPEIEMVSFRLMMAGPRRISSWLKAHPEEVHELIHTEDDLRTLVSLAPFANSEDRNFIRHHVYQSHDWYAWTQYVREIPEEAQLVQDQFITIALSHSKKSEREPFVISAYQLNSWLQDIRETNPVPVQYAISERGDLNMLVDATVRNNRLSLFATVFLILQKERSESVLTALMHKDKRTKEIKDIILTAIKEKYLNAQQITECVRTLMRWDRELIDEIEGMFIEQGHNVFMYAQEIRRGGPIQALVDAHHIMDS